MFGRVWQQAVDPEYGQEGLSSCPQEIVAGILIGQGKVHYLLTDDLCVVQDWGWMVVIAFSNIIGSMLTWDWRAWCGCGPFGARPYDHLIPEEGNCCIK